MTEPDVPTVRPGRGLYGYERALARAGLGPVAGVDEAGRGACAGPLVAAAVILADTPARRITGLKDSKLLTRTQREAVFEQVHEHAIAVAVARVEASECDRLGMHVADLQGLRQAVSRLSVQPGFVLTDGFAVEGLPAPGLAVWKGDQVAACVAAASVVAKVTRDRIMAEMAEQYPGYGFEVHKGYVTAEHRRALSQLGPCAEHRMLYQNVREAARGHRTATAPVD